MSELRDIALTVTAVLAMIGALGTAAAFSWKAMQWATTQVERARKVTALVAEVPLLAAELAKVATILTNLVERVDQIAKVAGVNEKAATQERVAAEVERSAQSTERLRVGGVGG